MRKIIILILLFGVACGSVITKSEFKQTAGEIQDILKSDKNLTPEQKVILRHAVVNLQDADRQSREKEKLQDKLVSTSKDAGAGRMMYVLCAVLALGIVAFVISKFTKLF